jgi:hypothetical protein
MISDHIRMYLNLLYKVFSFDCDTVTKLYGLPPDVCSLPSFEAGLAIEDDYPKIGCCMLTSNMPCDSSIMTSMIQDRRIGLPTQQLNVPLRWKREDVQEYAVEEILSAIDFIEKHTGMDESPLDASLLQFEDDDSW